METNPLSRARFPLKLAEAPMFRSRAAQVFLPVCFSVFSLSAAEIPKVTFLRDVAPILNKVGCTSGTCHGAAKGKNGFKLSLRGYDPQFDHQALTDELEGRRFNRAAPERSLMLLKPAGEAPHVGGMLFKPGDPYYEIIKAWIAAGVKL